MKSFRTISVAELRAALADEDDNALVIFATDYGDHAHTEQALPLHGDFEEVLIEESAYSNSGFAVKTEDDEDEDDDVEPVKYLKLS